MSFAAVVLPERRAAHIPSGFPLPRRPAPARRAALAGPALVLAALVLPAGCNVFAGRATPTTCASAPGISAAANPWSVLAVSLAVPARGADSARALYRVDDGGERATPFVRVRGPLAHAAVLGLREHARLLARVELRRGERADTSPVVRCVAGTLPRALRGIRLETRYGLRSGGYILTELLRGKNVFAVAFDSVGHLVWYRDLGRAHSVGDVKQQPNGDVTAYVGNSFGWQADSTSHFVELRPTGELVREFRAPPGYYTDPHELRLVFQGDSLRAAYFFGYDLRHVRAARDGRPRPVAISAHTIFRGDGVGAAVPLAHGWKLFALADTAATPHDATDFDHPNSLDFDRDGNLIVSFRNFDQVAKLDARTGAVIWRLGGPRGDFRFVGDPLGGFAGQHYARVLANGDLLLYDNRWSRPPLASRAVEYRLDPASHTATLVSAFEEHPLRYTDSTGSVQRLASGYTLVEYAHDYVLDEFNAAGEEVAEAAVTGASKLGVGYRMLDVPSLYEYEAP